MKIPIVYAALLAACCSSGLAQIMPGAPEENGVTPKSNTVYINRQTAEITGINNNNTESLGVAIANGGNVIVGWEDDGDGIEDTEAVWTMFDSTGVSITPDTKQVSLTIAGGVITNKFLSYFRADGSATPGITSWGPKIHANAYGDGVGMGATSYLLGEEVKEFAAYDDENQGDFPSVQLLSNTGTPVKTLAGVSAAYATRDAGSIRIGDWEYLSDGNIVIVGESRQKPELVSVYGGSAEETHVIYSVVDQAGKVIKAETLASQTPDKAEMWHGAASVQDGFAIRFLSGNRATIRLYDNSGNPTSTNIDLGTLTGHEEAAGGGRGDGTGFHGNGKDAYVVVNGTGADVWLTVLDAKGAVRYSKAVADDLTLTGVGRADAAIDPDGNVIVAFEGKIEGLSTIMGRRFDATGKPVGGTFYVSEKEAPGTVTGAASGPRIAWRAGQVAIVWESNNDTETINPDDGNPKTVAALRLFSTFNPGTLESVGLTRIVADTPVLKPAQDNLDNWEPYASVLGTSTFLVEANAFAVGTTDSQRYVVALQPAAGGAPKTVDGFYADNGQPFGGVINLSRQNGNPGRVAGDKRPGAVNYIVGGEASPHMLPEFGSDNRWKLGFDRLSDGRYATIQTYKLDTASLTPTPLMKAQDSALGRLTSGAAAGNQISRFGGELAGLDNGNFVSVVEDRSRALNPDGNAVVATIFAPDGAIVKDTFIVAPTADATARDVDIWSNAAAYKGGFVVRTKNPEGNSRWLYFFDNAGTLKGTVDQAASGTSFDPGRGDGTRIFAHINSPYVYLVGKATTGPIVKVAVFDSRDQKFVAIADVSEGGFSGDFDRAIGAVDALDRLVISWVVKPAGYAQQQVAARVLAFDAAAKKITPLTASFFPFVNTATNDIRSIQMNLAMTTKQILVAAKGEINYDNKPALGPNSPKQVNFYTVFSHPAPKDDPTTPAGGGAGAGSVQIAAEGGQVVITWTSGTLVSSTTVKGAYVPVAGAASPYKVAPTGAAVFYQVKQ